MKKILTNLIIEAILVSISLLLSTCKKKEAELPTILTIAVSQISYNSAISGGNINNDGGATVLGRGLVWGTNQQPKLETNNGFSTDGSGVGIYSSTIAGLNASTTYYVRAYATNSAGTAYGSQVSFTTTQNIIVPTLTTTAITGITSSTATGGGNISSDGGATISIRGVCWSTSQNPTTADSKTTDGIGAGSFTSSITGLTAGTTYHVRAYATNSVGTAYGNDVSFATTSGGQTGTVTDIDGNVYNTVTIGTQVWMAENLKTTKYNDGTSIPNVTVSETWIALTTGAYCDYANTPANSATYGRLYNWYVADNNAATKVASNGGKNVCPTGWHVPADAEWTTLTTYLGGESVAGGKLKETGTTHWISPNTGATNETGFTALPGGGRGSNGSFGAIGSYGDWWSSTEYDATYAWYCYMYYYDSDVGRGSNDKLDGFSVRCLRDN